jgi:tetratricopeptide (TPR) repeat protein
MRGDAGPLTGKDRLDVLLLAGAWKHIEYATKADIDEAARLAKTSSDSPYVFLAIKGLVAGKRFQEAFDVVSSFPAARGGAFLVLTEDLVRAGEVEKVPMFARQMSSPLETRQLVHHIVMALAEMGKIEEAVAMGVSNQPGTWKADMLIAIGKAYAQRGEPKEAAKLFDRAKAALEDDLSAYAKTSGMELRFALISLQALRGDTKAVNKSLQEMRPPSNAPDLLTEIYRDDGYQRLLQALLYAQKSRFARDLAKSTPEPGRAMNLAIVAMDDAANGRLDEARTILSLMGDKAEPRIRVMVVDSIAVAAAKAGDLAAAIGMASQVSDPIGRKGVLFAISHTLPQ